MNEAKTAIQERCNKEHSLGSKNDKRENKGSTAAIKTFARKRGFCAKKSRRDGLWYVVYASSGVQVNNNGMTYSQCLEWLDKT